MFGGCLYMFGNEFDHVLKMFGDVFESVVTTVFKMCWEIVWELC